MASDEIPPGELTERLVDRLCHDLAGSFQALASGLDLLSEADSPEMRQEAAALLADAFADQRAKVAFARRAFGSAPPATASGDLAALARELFAGHRARIDWVVGAEALGPAGARCLINLVQIAAECLAMGGEARVAARRDETGTLITVEALGPRAVLRDETRSGLAGQSLSGGLAGRWVQGALVSELARAAGGAVRVEEAEGAISFRVDLPPRD
ncbi:MAG TPA: histidine phosphotransferase family protein [Caulobacteraceae bacterium]|jgi:histidine phosphotransferase ChpT